MDERLLTDEQRQKLAAWKAGVERSIPELVRMGDRSSARELQFDKRVQDAAEGGVPPATPAQKRAAERVAKDVSRLP